MAKDINIKYTDKNFNNLRQNLIELSKTYFPDSYNDFSPTSPGMMFMEMSAYVGDILSFYQDSQLQETYLQYAKDPSNLYTMAYMLGYRPKVSCAATVPITITQRVQASGSTFDPNWNQALSISAGVQLETGNQKFYISDPINFTLSSSADPTDVTVYSISNGVPSEYLLSKKAHAQAGEIVTTSIVVGDLVKYYTFDIDDSNILGIIDITDSNGNEYFEVPYLAQNSIMEQGSYGSLTNPVPYPLNLSGTERRFVSRFKSSGKLQIQFGPGGGTDNDIDLVPRPDVTGAPGSAGVNRMKYAYDPSNFLYTTGYGISPANTTLTVRYLRGGGVESNVDANTLNTSTNVSSTATDTSYQGTLAFTNLVAATGGKDGDTIDELRQNTLRAFNEQGRLVTKEDFAYRALSMNPKYGVVAKAYVTTREAVSPANSTESDPLDVCLYVLSYNSIKKLITADDAIKENLKTYLSEYMILTDSLEIKDAYVINIGIKYDIIARPNFNSREVLFNCSEELKTYFNPDKWHINQPINLSSVYTLLDRVKGVQTVKNIKVESKVGTNYSSYDYDIEGATKENIIYPSLDPMIFEVKFPNQDIQGRITTL